MISLKEYQNKNMGYINSIQSYIENKPITMYESLIIEHGKHIDSVLYKMSVHNNRLANPNFIHESWTDVAFTLEEQYAARDILITVCEQYQTALFREFCASYEIPIDEGFQSVKDLINKVGNAVKKASDKVKTAYQELKGKLKVVGEFIKDVTNKAINSAKQLVERINDMMDAIGTNFAKLVQKLGGSDDDFETFNDMLKEAVKAEKTAKENIYESFAEKLSSNNVDEEFINEFLGFGKKKKKEEDTPKATGNEYDDAENAKEGSSNGRGTMNLWKVVGKILLQMLAYYGATVILPAIVTLAFGPIAGAVVEVLAKAIWSSATIYKQVKDMIKTCKSEEYKKSKWWKKGLRWLLFIISMYFACKALHGAASDGANIINKWMSGKISEVLPSDVVTSMTEIFNDFFKKITGENASGYDKLVEAQNLTYERVIEVAGEGQEASDAAKEKFGDHANKGEFDPSETNNFDKTREIAGDELADKMKEVADAGEKSSKAVLDNVSQIHVDTPGVTAFAVDGATLGKIGRAEYIEQIAKQLNVSPSDIDISQVTDTALRSATNGQAGTFFQVIIKGDATKEFADAANAAVDTVAKNAGMGGGFFHMLSNVADNISPVKQILSEPADLFKNTFAAFAGLFPIAAVAIKDNGGFRLRLGSGRTGNWIYDIEEDGLEKLPYTKFAEKYKERNPKVFSNMEKIIRDNVKLLQEVKSELESKKNLSKDDKKKLNRITNHLEKMKEGTEDYDVLIFLTHDKRAESIEPKKKDENTNESLIEIDEAKKKEVEKSDKLFPVAFINPLIMAGGDLARGSSSKKPRANLYFAKGLFSRWELLPMDGGMSKENIMNMFTDIMKEAVKSCYNMCADMPCYKDGKKYVENKESAFAGKERKDFGGFTNEEITDIMNNPDDIAKYFGGKYASDILSGGKHQYSERTDREDLKEHHDKVVKQYKEIIETDEEIKKFIEDSKTLKKFLLNDDGTVNDEELEKISDNLIRVEQNYINKKKKKSFFSKIKSWFTGVKDEDDKIDPKELASLAFKLASKRIKLKKQRVAEGLEEYEDFTILETNLEIIESYINDTIVYEDFTNDEPDDLLN